MKHYIMVVGMMAALCGCSSSPPKSAESTAPAAESKKAVTAPGQFNVKFDTSKGAFTLEVHRDWAPRGVDHFYELLQAKFFDDARFFRVVPNFVVQFGISGDPKVTSLWGQLNLPDDPVKQSNLRGTITYATAGPNTRTTQLFINLGNNRMLDSQGFAPFGKVVDGMSVVDSLYSGYGDMAPSGSGPDPMKIETQGNDYLARYFGRLDSIKTARVEGQ